MRDFNLGRDLYAQLAGPGEPHRGPVYMTGHSLGGVSGLMESIKLKEQDPASVAGHFSFGLVAGFAHQADPADKKDKPGFLARVLESPSQDPNTAGQINKDIIASGKPILGLAVPPVMWFNPRFVKQYQDWNLLAYGAKNPAKMQLVAPLMSIVTAVRDGMAQPLHVEKLYQRHYLPGMELHKIPEADHLFTSSRSGAAGNTDVVQTLINLLDVDFRQRRKQLTKTSAGPTP